MPSLFPSLGGGGGGGSNSSHNPSSGPSTPPVPVAPSTPTGASSSSSPSITTTTTTTTTTTITTGSSPLPPPPPPVGSPRVRPLQSPSSHATGTAPSTTTTTSSGTSSSNAFTRLFTRPTFEFSRPTFDFGGSKKATTNSPDDGHKGAARRSSSITMGLSLADLDPTRSSAKATTTTNSNNGKAPDGQQQQQQPATGANVVAVGTGATGSSSSATTSSPGSGTPPPSGDPQVVMRTSEDGFGISAKVQWSSPVRKKGDTWASTTTGWVGSGGGHLQRMESGQIEEDNEDGPEEVDDGVFTHGECLSFHLTFGPGPIGLVVADTKASKGVYVEDFIKIQTKGGPVATAAELSGRIKIGDVITHVGSTDVQFSAASVVRDLLEKSARPVTLSFERFPQRYSFKEVSLDPRKMPFYFEYLLTDDTIGMEDSRHEQAKVMFWMESDQFRQQYKNMNPSNRPKEAKRIFDKFLRPHISQFDVTGVVGEEIMIRIIDAYHAAGGEGGSGAAPPDDSRLSGDMFEEAKSVVEEDIKSGSFQGFRKCKAYNRMVGFLSRSPEFVPLEAKEVLADPDMLQFFMMFLMAARRHASLRCYLDMERLVKPRVAALEAVIKEGKAETPLAKEVAVSVMQGALRVHSLYLGNGAYMELSLKPLTHLGYWLRSLIAAKTDIARIQRRASKLSSKTPGKMLETEVVGSQLLRLAHSQDPNTQMLFNVTVAEAMAVGLEMLDAQRTILRELACDVFPRFQCHAIYEALCEEIGPDWRTMRLRSRRLSLKSGSIKRLLRKVKLPREFAVHRTALPRPPANNKAAAVPPTTMPATTEGSPAAGMKGEGGGGDDGGGGLDSAADWLVIFDTEFSQNLGLKVRTTSQIPVSAYAADISGDKRASCLPRGVENFLVPEEFPTKVSFSEPEPLLFNFLIPGRDDHPFYGACLIMYRAATEAMLEDDDDEDDEEGGGGGDGDDDGGGADDETLRAGTSKRGSLASVIEAGNPASPILHVDLTLSGTYTAGVISPTLLLQQQQQQQGAAPSTMTTSAGAVTMASVDGTPGYSHRGSDASVRSRSTTQSSAAADLPDGPVTQPVMMSSSGADSSIMMRQRKMSFKIERGDEDEHKIKTIASLLLYSSPKHEEARKMLRNDGTDAERVDSPVFKREDEDPSPTPMADDADRHDEGGGEEGDQEGGDNQQQQPGSYEQQEVVEGGSFLAASSPPLLGGGGQDAPSVMSGGGSGLSSGNQLDQELGAMPVVVEEGDEEEDDGDGEREAVGGKEIAQTQAAPPPPPSVHDDNEVFGDGADEENDSIIALVAADFQESQMHIAAGGSGGGLQPPSSMGGTDLHLLRDGPDGDRFFGSSPSTVSSTSTPSTSSKTSFALPSSSRRAPTSMDDARFRRGSTSMSSSGGPLSWRGGVVMSNPLTFAPYGFCLISRMPFINSLRTPLAALFDQRTGSSKATPIRIIQEALAKQAPVRPPLSATDNHDLLTTMASLPSSSSIDHHKDVGTANANKKDLINAQLDFEIETLFRCLSPRNIVTVFLALLLECKIVLVSERLTLLTVVAESLRLLIQPLRWCHVYVPLLPEVMVDHLIGCPTPFIMGLHRKTLLAKEDFPLADVVKVDLDNDLVDAPTKDLHLASVPFAAPLARKFERYAGPYTALTDSFRWPNRLATREPDPLAALRVLRDFVESLLVSMEDCCYRLCTETEMTILFDEILFGHINGPPELIGPCLADMESDMLEHAPQLRGKQPFLGTSGSGRGGGGGGGGQNFEGGCAGGDGGMETFVLRFSRTQAFSQHLMRSLQQQYLLQQAPPPTPSSPSSSSGWSDRVGL